MIKGSNIRFQGKLYAQFCRLDNCHKTQLERFLTINGAKMSKDRKKKTKLAQWPKEGKLIKLIAVFVAVFPPLGLV